MARKLRTNPQTPDELRRELQEIDARLPAAVRLPAITAPTGGATVDAEARTAINAIIAALTAAGITL